MADRDTPVLASWSTVVEPSASSWSEVASNNTTWSERVNASSELGMENNNIVITEGSMILYTEQEYAPGEIWQTLEAA